ncbi:hypothetical protein YDYSY3_14530 [Paenibacillus chitinolyticus]|uniref:SdpI family protein n=1 Tax=Paenibacillus chitinolyticus TaxID=79263 RepID=UPI0026E4F318|nr:SdpI family protein [Paenibacillus chitinolyticus]GKS10453.1 hypothetical protein YDYSY3_14530 [Paenibacillus chitinolyticus]
MTNAIRKTARWTWKDTLLLIIAAAPILYAIGVYGKLPELMAVHFGTGGEANGYQSKGSFLILMSALNLALPLLMKWPPSLDPKRNNYEKFQGFYDLLRILVTVLLSGVFFIIILTNLGYDVPINFWVPLGVGALWMVIGNYMGRARPNYTFGIRTPWTLADEEVWRRTHRMAGPIWMLAGIVFIGVSLFPSIVPAWFGIVVILLSVLVPTLYSFIKYRERKN